MTRRLVIFFSLTFLITWICWAGSLVISNPTAPADPVLAGLGQAVFLLGVFTPGLLGIAFTTRIEGREAANALLSRIFKWDVGARWYVFAILYMPAVKLLAALGHRLITGAWPGFGQVPIFLMLAALTVSTWVQAGEEVGWRGYALPRLSERVGLGPASIIIGIIWATWHLPLFFFFGGDTRDQSFPLYLLQAIAISVTMAWLYLRTNGSLLLVMLLHAAINNLKDIVPSAAPGATNPWTLHASIVGWITVTVLWTAAAYFLFQMRGATLATEAD